jgi:cytosine/adenosine deaminase-related metal-dependent hydrolase
MKLFAERRTICTVITPTMIHGQRISLIKALVRSGCIVALSTDHRVTAEDTYQYVTGVEHMVTQIGMTPGEAIVAATRNGARASKALDKYGTLEAGKAADVLILSADPLADIRNIRTLEQVILGGRIVQPCDDTPSSRQIRAAWTAYCTHAPAPHRGAEANSRHQRRLEP